MPERAVPTRPRQGLKAGQGVGVLATPGRSVETLPKIEGENGAVRKALIHMLAVAHDLPVADGAPAALATQRRDLLERVVRLFAERLLAAVRRDLPRRYVAREDDPREAPRHTPDHASRRPAGPTRLLASTNSPRTRL